MEIPVPTVEELGLEINDLLQERQNLKKLKDDIELRLHELDGEIGNQLDQKEVRKVVWDDYLVIRRQGSTPRPILDRVMLLEAGVSPQQIKAGTKFGAPGKPGVTVRALSEAKAAGFDSYPRY